MFEYKVIPAPRKAVRNKGAKGTAERFSATMESTLNDMSAEGWSFLRAETLPVDERQGVMRKVVEEFHTVLIFSRPVAVAAAAEPAPSRPAFFAEKTPAEVTGPTLGAAASDPAPAVTAELKAVKDDAADDPVKPARKAAAKARK